MLKFIFDDLTFMIYNVYAEYYLTIFVNMSLSNELEKGLYDGALPSHVNLWRRVVQTQVYKDNTMILYLSYLFSDITFAKIINK